MALEFETRYFLEHKALPSNLYSNGTLLLDDFSNKGGRAMCDYYGRAEMVNETYCCPYDEDDFEAHVRTYIRNGCSCTIVRVEMPEPEQPLLCRAVYLCGTSIGTQRLYATSEFAETGEFYLCCWTPDGSHINFGEAPDDPNDEFDMVADLYWEAYNNGKRKRPEGLCSGEG